MSSSRLALAAALALVAAAAPAAAKKPDAAPEAAAGAVDAKNLSKGVRPLLAQAQKLEGAGDLPGALAQVRLAEAVPGINPTDQFFIAQMKLGIASKTKDDKLMVEALKSAVGSDFLPATEKPKYLRNLASLALNANDYDAATHYYEQLAVLAPNDTEVLTNLSILYSRQKQTPQAIATLRKAIAAAKASGKPADENLYRTVLKLAFDAKMPADVQAASLDLVTAYPTPTNWRDALLLFRDSQKLDDQTILDVFRLDDAAGALAGEADYNEYVELAITKGFPGEARAVLNEGIAKKMVTQLQALCRRPEQIDHDAPRERQGRAGDGRQGGARQCDRQDRAGPGRRLLRLWRVSEGDRDVPARAEQGRGRHVDGEPAPRRGTRAKRRQGGCDDGVRRGDRRPARDAGEILDGVADAEGVAACARGEASLPARGLI